ncbi:MAG: hypothetical protein HC789_18980 [Microcoleus sp. CSU_2_2]|nr:hypothetical protein [Microcoleus sp. SU_5_3]NJS12305.1 hypothetical protein [Microcoleus sp. CSU_2_2]
MESKRSVAFLVSSDTLLRSSGDEKSGGDDRAQSRIPNERALMADRVIINTVASDKLCDRNH